MTQQLNPSAAPPVEQAAPSADAAMRAGLDAFWQAARQRSGTTQDHVAAAIRAALAASRPASSLEQT